jgi:hypothetical protein
VLRSGSAKTSRRSITGRVNKYAPRLEEQETATKGVEPSSIRAIKLEPEATIQPSNRACSTARAQSVLATIRRAAKTGASRIEHSPPCWSIGVIFRLGGVITASVAAPEAWPIFAPIRRASSFVSSFAADRPSASAAIECDHPLDIRKELVDHNVFAARVSPCLNRSVT